MQTTTQLEAQNDDIFSQEYILLIYRYIYNYIRNEHEAQDLTSQVFLKAVNHLDLKRSIQHRKAWLFQVARTTIVDYWRAHYRHATIHSLDKLLEAGWEGPVVEDKALLTSYEPIEQVNTLLQALPARYRQVLTYRFLLQLTVRETARSMGLSENHVKVIQSRALKRAAKLDAMCECCG